MFERETIKVETQGSIGVENELTPEEILFTKGTIESINMGAVGFFESWTGPDDKTRQAGDLCPHG